MFHKQTSLLLLCMLAGAPVLAQEGGEKLPTPCTTEPIFHCVESLDSGGAIAHFGYRTTCPATDKPLDDIYVPIGDDNHFKPEPVDRGQPTVFMPGEHVDEFEVEYSADEIKKAGEIAWILQKIAIRVDLSKSKDAALDCNNLPY